MVIGLSSWRMWIQFHVKQQIHWTGAFFVYADTLGYWIQPFSFWRCYCTLCLEMTYLVNYTYGIALCQPVMMCVWKMLHIKQPICWIVEFLIYWTISDGHFIPSSRRCSVLKLETLLPLFKSFKPVPKIREPPPGLSQPPFSGSGSLYHEKPVCSHVFFSHEWTLEWLYQYFQCHIFVLVFIALPACFKKKKVIEKNY